MKRACVIGWPIGHSRSPVIHNYWLAAYGIEGEYTAVPVPPEELKNFLQNLPAAGYVGCNVTIPHKQAAFGYLTVRDPVSRAIGAINTVYIRDGETYGVNTDAPGFISSLVAGAQSAGWQQTPAAVLGAGGAARAIVFALRDAGVPEIRISNRTRSRAEELARAVGPTAVVADWSSRNDVLAGCGLLVNATALGMDGKPPLDIDLAHLPTNAIVTDIVYTPLTTPLLDAALRRGNPVVDGLGMLLHQAVPGFELWFGVKPEVTPALRAHVAADLEAAE